MYFSKSKFRFVVQFCLVAFSLSLTFLSFLAEKRIFLYVGNIDGQTNLFTWGQKFDFDYYLPKCCFCESVESTTFCERKLGQDTRKHNTGLSLIITIERHSTWLERFKLKSELCEKSFLVNFTFSWFSMWILVTRSRCQSQSWAKLIPTLDTLVSDVMI